MKRLTLISMLLCFEIKLAKLDYQTTYIEDLCNEDSAGVWNLGSSSANSSGILKTTRSKEFLPNRNCSIFLQPPLGYGVTLSVEHLDFRPFYPPDCQNFVQISDHEVGNVKLCGYSDDVAEFQSYFSEGQALELLFVTSNGNQGAHHSDVTFIVTSYLKVNYRCGIRMFQCLNDRCIWDGLACDGYNNCGDQSDEMAHSLSNCMMTPGLIAGISVGAALCILLFLIVPIACLRCRSRRRNNRRSDPPLISPASTYGTSDARNSIQEREETVQASSSYGPSYQDLPPAYKP